MKKVLAIALVLSLGMVVGCGSSNKPEVVTGGTLAAGQAGTPASAEDAQIDKLQQQINDLKKAKPVPGVVGDLAADFDAKVLAFGSPVNSDQVAKGTAHGLPNGWVMFKTVSGRWFIVEYTPAKTGDVYGRLIEIEPGR